MNILVVSENFLSGGLETQLKGQVDFLKQQGHKVILLCSNFDQENEPIFDEVVAGIKFDINTTSDKFISVVDFIMEYIYDKKIDLIHVHPFNSIFAATIAAAKTKTKIVYTAHGPSSLNFFSYRDHSGYLFDQLILNEGFDYYFAVGKHLEVQIRNTFDTERVKFLPNGININEFSESKFPNNKKWALATRLDPYKVKIILHILPYIDDLPIKQLDIYGDGDQKDLLEDYIKENGLEDKVRLMGFSRELGKELKDNYDGVLGHGRAFLEGLSLNLPSILLTYHGVIGACTKENLESFSLCNFIGRGDLPLEEVQVIELFKNIYEETDRYRVRNEVAANFDEKIIWGNYLNIVDSIEFNEKPLLNDLYYIIRSMESEETLIRNKEFSKKLIDNFSRYLGVSINMVQDYLFKNDDIEQIIYREINDQKEKVRQLEERLSIKDGENKQLEELLRMKDKDIENIVDSLSWRVTKPARAISSLLRRKK